MFKSVYYRAMHAHMSNPCKD